MTVELLSFDGTEACHGSLVAPDRYRDLHAVLAGPGPFAARGAGLSFCQASAGDGVTTISTRSFNRSLAFDPDRLQVTVEPGATVSELGQDPTHACRPTAMADDPVTELGCPLSLPFPTPGPDVSAEGA
jgi:hypothetical protein